MPDAWPEFSIPDVSETETQVGSTPPEGETSGVTPAAPVAAQPPAPHGTQPRAPVASDAGGESIPKYRFDEQAERLRSTQEQLQTVMGLMKSLQSLPKESPGEPPDPRKERIVAELLEVMPELGKARTLAERADEITQLLEEAKFTRAEREQRDTQYARTSVARLWDGYAEAVLGKGKTGRDLPAETREIVKNSFIQWIGSDTTGERINRYNAFDETLRTEFMTAWRKAVIDPLRRETLAGRAASARRIANLPVAGGTASALGQPSAKPETDDEDAVYDRAWEMTRQLKEQGV